jgi:hypothetical protein
MNPADYEATLAAARQLVQAGPFWVLDLWDSLPPGVQVEVVETLMTRRTFRAALGGPPAAVDWED